MGLKGEMGHTGKMGPTGDKGLQKRKHVDFHYSNTSPQSEKGAGLTILGVLLKGFSKKKELLYNWNVTTFVFSSMPGNIFIPKRAQMQLNLIKPNLSQD